MYIALNECLPHLNYQLDETEIMEDLKIINKVSGKPINRKPQVWVKSVILKTWRWYDIRKFQKFKKNFKAAQINS